MDCEKFDAHVMDELYDELDDITHAALRRHVDGCGRCSTAFAGLRATRSAAMLPIEEPSDDLEERILAAAVAAQRTVPWPKRALRAIAWAGSHAMRPQLAMAAVLVLILGSSLLLLRARPGAAPLAPVRVSERGEPLEDKAPAEAAPPPEAAAAVAAARPMASAAAPADMAPGAAAPKAEEAELAKEKADEAQRSATADAPFAAARGAVASSGCAAAESKRDEVTKRSPGSPAAAAATWDAAECYRSAGDDARARALYATLRSDATYGERAGEKLASYDKARTYVGGGVSGAAAAAPARAAAAPEPFAMEAPAAAPPPPATKAAAPKANSGSSGSRANAAPVKQQAVDAY